LRYRYNIFRLQPEVSQDVTITKASEYRLVIRYVNLGNTSATGTVKIIPENVQEVFQTFPVVLKPSKEPTFVTIPGPLIMNSPGPWTIRFSLKNIAFLVINFLISFMLLSSDKI